MKKVIFWVPESLDERIVEHMEKYGYPTKAGFFRQLAQHHLDRYERMLADRKAGINLPLRIY